MLTLLLSDADIIVLGPQLVSALLVVRHEVARGTSHVLDTISGGPF